MRSEAIAVSFFPGKLVSTHRMARASRAQETGYPVMSTASRLHAAWLQPKECVQLGPHRDHYNAVKKLYYSSSDRSPDHDQGDSVI